MTAAEAAVFARIRKALCPFSVVGDLDEYALAVLEVCLRARR